MKFLTNPVYMLQQPYSIFGKFVNSVSQTKKLRLAVFGDLTEESVSVVDIGLKPAFPKS